MPDYRKIPQRLLRGGTGQAEIAAETHSSKRDSSRRSKAIRERCPTYSGASSSRARGTDSFQEETTRYRDAGLPVLDDFLLTPVGVADSALLVDLMAKREGRTATIIDSQAEPGQWHMRIQGRGHGRERPQPACVRLAQDRDQGARHARVPRRQPARDVGGAEPMPT